MLKGLIVVFAVISLGCSTAAPAGSSHSSARPTLRIIKFTPLSVQGRNFVPNERVKVTVNGRSAKRKRADRKGFFALSLGVAVDRCNSVRIRAVGSSGSQATMKILPSPACLPAGSG